MTLRNRLTWQAGDLLVLSPEWHKKTEPELWQALAVRLNLLRQLPHYPPVRTPCESSVRDIKIELERRGAI